MPSNARSTCMRTTLARAGCTIAFTALAFAASAAEPSTSDDSAVLCPSSSTEVRLEGNLARLRARLAEGDGIKILAFGSSSTSGAGASNDRKSYPSQLAKKLGKFYSGKTVEVVNAGVPGEDVNSMVGRLGRELETNRPDLVIWQVGTNALLRRLDRSVFANELQRGVDLVRAFGADIILMDLQYAPRVVNEASHARTLAMLEEVSRRNHVALFRRFALMREWAHTMAPAYSSMLSSDGLHMNDRSYACLADRLAMSIYVAVGAAAAPSPRMDARAGTAF